MGAASNTYTGAQERIITNNAKTVSSQNDFNDSMVTSRGAMRQTAQEMTNYIARAAGMFISTVGLSQAVQESVGMHEALADQEEKVAEAQQHLNDLINSGTASTREITSAKNALAKAERGETVIARNAAFAYSDQLYFVALLGVELISVLIPAYKRLKDAQSAAAASGIPFWTKMNTNIKETSANFKKGFSSEALLGSAGAFSILWDLIGGKKAKGATKVIEEFGEATIKGKPKMDSFLLSGKGVTDALGRMGVEAGKTAPLLTRLGATAAKALGIISGPIGWAITAVAVGLEAYATNAGGARDATNALGVAVGNYLQVFKPFGEVLVGIAGKLGLTGESADQVAVHFEKAAQGFGNMSTLWNNTVADLISSTDKFEQAVGTAFDSIGQSTSKIQADFNNQVSLMQQGWNRFWSAIATQDYSAAVDEIVNAFVSIPSILGTIVGDVNQLFGSIGTSIGAFVTDMSVKFVRWQQEVSPIIQSTLQGIVKFFVDSFTNIVGIVGEIGARAGAAFMQGLESWGNIIGNAIEQWKIAFTKGAETIGNAIIGGLSWVGGEILKILDPSTWVGEAFAETNSKSTVDSWVKTNITDPINKFITNITVTAGEIWTQIESTAGNVTGQVMTWINTNIVDPIDSFIENITVTADKIWSQIVSGAGNIMGQVMTWVNGNIVDPINRLPANILEMGGQIVQRILNGDYINQIITWATNVASQIGAEVLKALKPLTDPINKLFPGLGKMASGLGLGGTASTGGMSQEQIDKANAERTKQEASMGITPENRNQSFFEYGTGQLFGGQTIPSAYGAEGQRGGYMNASGELITPSSTRNLSVKPGSPADPNTQRNIAPQANKQSPLSGTTTTGLGLGSGAGASGAAGILAAQKTAKDLYKAPTGPTVVDLGQTKTQAQLTPPPPTPEEQELARQNARNLGLAQKKTDAGQLKGLDEKTLKSLGETPEDRTGSIADLIGKYYELIDAEKMEAGQLIQFDELYSGLRGELKTTEDGIVAMDAALKTEGYSRGLVQKGINDQKIKYQELQAGILSNIGVIGQYNSQLESQQFMNDNVTAGMQAQQIAFNDQTVAIAQNQGALQAYAGELASGRLQSNAFTEGMQAQEQSFYDTIIASEQAQGSYTKLNEQLGQGLIQNAAWNKGLAEGRLEMANQTLAIEEAKGSLTAYQEGIASGVAEQNAFNMAIFETNRAVAEDFVALSSAKGALQEYTHLIEQGIPQYNAYNKAVLDQRMAFQEVAVEIAALKGTTDEFFAGMKEAANVQNMISKAFEEGRASIQGFAEDLYTAGAASAGALTQLDAFATTLGYDLPNSFKLTEDSAKGLVSAFSGIPGVINQLASESAAAGRGLLDGVVGAVQEGGKEVNEELDKLEEELGTNFPESVKDALENSAMTTAMADGMTKMIDLGQEALRKGADRLEVKEMVDEKAQEYMDAWEENSIPMNESTATIFDSIRESYIKRSG